MLPGHGIKLWPGYTTSIRRHEQEVLICAEISTKILRTDTVYKRLKDLRTDMDKANREIIGQIVMTRYNNKTYRVDEIDWKKRPIDTFEVSERCNDRTWHQDEVFFRARMDVK